MINNLKMAYNVDGILQAEAAYSTFVINCNIDRVTSG